MPFKKGVCANPLGVGVVKKNQKRLVKDLLSPYGPRAVKEIVAQLDLEEPRDRQWATEMIMNYAYGKPTQAVDLGMDDGAIKLFVELIKKS